MSVLDLTEPFFPPVEALAAAPGERISISGIVRQLTVEARDGRSCALFELERKDGRSLSCLAVLPAEQPTPHPLANGRLVLFAGDAICVGAGEAETRMFRVAIATPLAPLGGSRLFPSA